MPSCAILTCRRRSQEKSSVRVTFHLFPRQPDLRKQWIGATGRHNWKPTKRSTICSQHFDERDYLFKKSNRRFLMPGSVPHKHIAICTSVVPKLIRQPIIKPISDVVIIPAASTADEKTCQTNVVPKLIRQPIIKPISDVDIIPAASTADEKTCQTNFSMVSNTKLPLTVHTMKLIPVSSTELPIPDAPPRRKKTRTITSIINSKDILLKKQRLRLKRVQEQNRRLKRKLNKVEDALRNFKEKYCIEE